VDDDRVAIIRCYAAMQTNLERAGLGHSAVRTPAELLSEAAGRGLVAVEPASALTELFERARFSSDPLDATDRQIASRALTRLRSVEAHR
jgi:hypothetical protein